MSRWIQGDFSQLLDKKRHISVKNELILILKVSLCSPAYEVNYSIKEIFKSCLQASLTMAPDIRHDAANNILKKNARHVHACKSSKKQANLENYMSFIN